MTHMQMNERGPAEVIRAFETSKAEHEGTRSLFEYADALRRVGRCLDALKVYNKLEMAPVPETRRWLVQLYKGTTLKEMGRNADAEVAFAEACRLEPSTVPRVYLASALSAQERFDEAIGVLREALTREGDPDEVWLNIALNQRALGRLDSAITSIEAALRLSPDYPEAKETLADVTAALSVGKEGAGSM